MIDRMIQWYEAFMAMPIEGQVVTGAGALVAIVAIKFVWKLAFPVRWTVASALRVVAYLVHPRKRGGSNGNFNEAPAFDLSNKKKTVKTYAYYGGTDAVRGLTQEQMSLLDAAVSHYSIRGNGGLTAERQRRGIGNLDVPFDISNEKKTLVTYKFYSQSATAHLLDDNQINLLDAARISFGIPGNGGLGEERRRRKNGTSTTDGVTATVVPFDFTTREKAQAAYDYYAGTDVVQTLSQGQMDLISDAITTFNLEKNNGLAQERQRREMQQKQMKLQHPNAFVVVDAKPEPEVVVQKSQVTMENVA